MNKKSLFWGTMTTMLILFATQGSGQAQSSSGGFTNGCVVREWESDPTPSYQVRNPAECQRLDQRIDGGDGPDRGRVRRGFSSGSSKSPHKRHN